MLINALIIAVEHKELETKKGKTFLTEIVLIDTEFPKNLYIGQIWGTKFHNYESHKVFRFTVISVKEMNNKKYLTLLPLSETK